MLGHIFYRLCPLYEGFYFVRKVALVQCGFRKCENERGTFIFTTNALVDAHNNALYTLSKAYKAQIKAVDIVVGDISDDLKNQMKKNPRGSNKDNGFIFARVSSNHRSPKRNVSNGGLWLN